MSLPFLVCVSNMILQWAATRWQWFLKHTPHLHSDLTSTSPKTLKVLKSLFLFLLPLCPILLQSYSLSWLRISPRSSSLSSLSSHYPGHLAFRRITLDSFFPQAISSFPHPRCSHLHIAIIQTLGLHEKMSQERWGHGPETWPLVLINAWGPCWALSTPEQEERGVPT